MLPHWPQKTGLMLYVWLPEAQSHFGNWIGAFRPFGLSNAWGGPALRLCASAPVISAAFFIPSVGWPFPPCSIHMSSIPCLLISSYAWNGKHMGLVLKSDGAQPRRLSVFVIDCMHRCTYNTDDEPFELSNHRESNKHTEVGSCCFWLAQLNQW